eukprot:TRINITY_DN994_c0_g1_i1.p1 TRINITY_DN994_c0_g1~~TRINITY_DN994_c0_g1_i1.p1  ORF type:complete len:564 (-),score=53.34 TRINITY_DN994_c0_g1_i1:20-1690(-)
MALCALPRLLVLLLAFESLVAMCSAQCEHSVALMGSGSFTSGSPYISNSNCTWTLVPDATGTGIVLNFPLFVTETDYDKVSIYQGSVATGILVDVLSGTLFNPTFIIGGPATIVFTTQDQVSLAGWIGNFSTYYGTYASLTIPSGGFPAGGNTVTVLGANIGSGSDITSVTICSVAATIVAQTVNSVTVVSGAVATSGTSGPVIVSSASRGNSTVATMFSYTTPVIRNVAPLGAATVGGSIVTITGVSLEITQDIQFVSLCGVNSTILSQSSWEVVVRTAPTAPCQSGSIVISSSSTGVAILANAFYVVDVPTAWSCDPRYYSTGLGCDCDCGAWDPDCDNQTLSTIYNCFQNASLVLTGCVSPGLCAYRFQEIPAAWICDPLYYNASDGCDCGCGAYDPDCVTQPSLVYCDSNPFGLNASSFLSCSAAGLCTFNALPATWVCAPEQYDSGLECNCNCGAYDPDCDIAALVPLANCPCAGMLCPQQSSGFCTGSCNGLMVLVTSDGTVAASVVVPVLAALTAVFGASVVVLLCYIVCGRKAQNGSLAPNMTPMIAR